MTSLGLDRKTREPASAGSVQPWTASTRRKADVYAFSMERIRGSRTCVAVAADTSMKGSFLRIVDLVHRYRGGGLQSCDGALFIYKTTP